MENELIVVKQLPVIEEQLKTISDEIQKQVDAALSLVVTDDTLVAVKQQRAELRKSFTDLEDRRKKVKATVMKPYDEFEAVYKKYVTDVFRPADGKLKKRIDEVEQELKDKKAAKIEEYFAEAVEEKGIDFITFEELNLKVLLSTSIKSLKADVDKALEQIAGDLTVIEGLDHAAEVLVEYKQHRDLARAVLDVKTRKELLAAELEKQEEKEEVIEEKEVSFAEEDEVSFAEAEVSFADVSLDEPVKYKEEVSKGTVSKSTLIISSKDSLRVIALLNKEGIEFELVGDNPWS